MGMRKFQLSPITRVAVMIVISAATLTVILASYHSRLLVEQGGHLDGVPLVGNNDGYYYLEQALTLAEQDKGFLNVLTDNRQSMLLTYALAAAGPDKVSLQHFAIYLGPLLSLTMLLAVLPWAMETRSSFVMVVSSALALFAPYWITRTHVGFLDTDSLVPGLCLFALYCVHKFSVEAFRRWFWVLSYVLILAFLWLWWRPGTYISAGFVLCYLVYPSRRKIDLAFKVAISGAFIGVMILAAVKVQPFYKYAAYAISHAKLAFGGGTYSLVSNAIIELGSVTPWELGQKSLGSALLLVPAVYGTVLYCRRYRWRSLFLVSTWLFGAAAMVSQRFIPLFVPTAAFFAAYGLITLCEWGSDMIVSRLSLGVVKTRNALIVVCLLLLLGSVATNTITYRPKSYFSKSDLMLAELIRKTFPADTVIWTWWDYGYFFKYLTGMDTFFDGGSQSDLTCFTAAYPLIQNDTAIAAAWMKHFAVSSPGQLNKIKKHNEQWPDSVREFSLAIMRKKGQAKRPVALCLPARVYTTSGYLYSFAHIFDITVPPVMNHLDIFSKDGFKREPGSNSVMVPEEIVAKGYDAFGGVLNATGKTPDQFDFTAIPDPYLVFSDRTNFLAVTDRALVGSILFRLLGLFEGEKRHFDPVFYDYRSGGIWRVN